MSGQNRYSSSRTSRPLAATPESANIRASSEPSGEVPVTRGRRAMLRVWKPIACSIVAGLPLFTSAMAQNLEVKRYNPSEWTKGRFSEIVTVNGPGKTIYLAGIGAEEENAPAGASAPIRHLGDPYEQCKYAYDKIKRALSAHGGTLADAVKQVVYVTDIRYQ